MVKVNHTGALVITGHVHESVYETSNRSTPQFALVRYKVKTEMLLRPEVCCFGYKDATVSYFSCMNEQLRYS